MGGSGCRVKLKGNKVESGPRQRQVQNQTPCDGRLGGVSLMPIDERSRPHGTQSRLRVSYNLFICNYYDCPLII